MCNSTLHFSLFCSYCTSATLNKPRSWQSADSCLFNCQSYFFVWHFKTSQLTWFMRAISKKISNSFQTKKCITCWQPISFQPIHVFVMAGRVDYTIQWIYILTCEFFQLNSRFHSWNWRRSFSSVCCLLTVCSLYLVTQF